MKLSMHLEKGWRLGVGIILINQDNKIFMGERIDNKGAWQMPQGGVNVAINESLDNAAKRELYEETGVKTARIINQSEGWYYYYLPENLQTRLWGGKFLGQKQKWFLFNFEGTDEEVNLRVDKKPEFNNWQWVNSQDVLRNIVEFKKKIYKEVLEEFELITL
jgi:putative (di)nucleoside polyphosphate hydrolase